MQSQDPLVAPYWIDLEARLPGSAIFSRVTDDAHVLNRTGTLIAGSNSDFSDFQPRQVAIVTWETVTVFSRRILGLQVSAFLTLGDF